MSSTFARSLTELFPLTGDTIFDERLLLRMLAEIERRFRPLEQAQGGLEAAIAQVRQVGLNRINEVLTPAIQSIYDVQSRGFLLANSATPHRLVPGDILVFVIEDASQRALFVPSPFTALTRAATIHDYAVARTITYDREAGEYACEVLSAFGDEGPHSDWIIAALAGTVLTTLDVRDDAIAARDDALAAVQAAAGQVALANGAAGAAGGSASAAGAFALEASGLASTAGNHALDAEGFAEAAEQAALAAAEFYPANYLTAGQTGDAIEAVIDGAPANLATLYAIAASINNDPAFYDTLVQLLAAKAALVSPELTGTPTAPTASKSDSSTKLATTAHVQLNTEWTQIGATAAPNGVSTVTFSSIPTHYKDLLIVGEGIFTNIDANLSIAVSSNGASFNQAVLGATIAGSGAAFAISAYFPAARLNVAPVAAGIIRGAAAEGFGTEPENSAPIVRRTIGGITALRVAIGAGGAFAGGNIKLFGR